MHVQVKSIIIAASTKGVLNLTGTLAGTANRLLYSNLAGNTYVTASSGPPVANDSNFQAIGPSFLYPALAPGAASAPVP